MADLNVSTFAGPDRAAEVLEVAKHVNKTEFFTKLVRGKIIICFCGTYGPGSEFNVHLVNEHTLAGGPCDSKAQSRLSL